MKQAFECENITEIRTAIDQIDKNIIDLIAQRFQYVKAAAKFKTGETSVKAPDRVRAMLLQRRRWAAEFDLNPDVIEKMYAGLVNYFISEELKTWKQP